MSYDRTKPYYRHPWPNLDDAVRQLDLAMRKTATHDPPLPGGIRRDLNIALSFARKAAKKAQADYLSQPDGAA